MGRRDDDMRDQRKLREWLGQGLQAQLRRSAVAEVYSVSGPQRARETAAGGKTIVRPILDPRLKLTAQQRATGTCFGAYFEMVYSGGSSEFLREYVDGGGAAGGGHSERRASMALQVAHAERTLQAMPRIRYPLSGARKNIWRGRHDPITPISLMTSLCINGYSLHYVGITHQWVALRSIQQSKGKRARFIVPDRQQKFLSNALRDCLDAVADGWTEAGWNVPYEFGGVEFE